MRTDYEDRFARLRALRPNWDSYGARPIAEAAIVTVRHLLEDAAIVPTANGGVQIEWHRHGADIEIEVAPSGDVASVFWAQGDAADGIRHDVPGAAARRAPTDAMIDAALEVLIAYAPEPGDPLPRTRVVVERALRAALAASQEHP